jgi:DNA polymerase bacteriophage-type
VGGNVILWLDFESRKKGLGLKEIGLDRYAKDKTTEALMLAYALDKEKPSLWIPHEGPMPEDLLRMLLDRTIKKGAWNYNFEKDIFEFVLGIIIPQEDWIDPSVLCAYMSLPIGLHRAGEALSISGKKIHITGNNRPVKMFGEESKATKKMIKNGSPVLYFKDWNTHPDHWKAFCEYCLGDVISEREVYYSAVSFNCPMTEEEHDAWVMDQRMNETGVWIDRTFVENAKALAEEEANQIIDEMKVLTGLENPNSQKQMLGWLQGYGYPYDSIDMEAVEMGLKLKLPSNIKQVLELKQKLGGSAYKKLQSIIDRIGPDGRLRDQFVYHGAHTGRWAGRGVQLQNLYKSDKEVSKDLDKYVTAIRDRQPIDSDIPMMTIVASTIRSSFAAAPGNKLVVGDLAQIESRVLAVIAGCKAMIDAYAKGHDLYIEFMSWLLKKPTSEITKEDRARGKIVILGCGFQMGWKKFMDYAASFGVILTEKQAKEAVDGFREKYPEIVNLWKNLNDAVIRAVKIGLRIYQNGLIIDGRDPRMLKIILPSGRALHYLEPAIVTEMTAWGKLQEGVNYTAFDQKGARNKRLYGGLITENVVQAIARDLLLSGMFEAEREAMKTGGKLIMTIHDEIVIEAPLDSPFNLDVLLSCMKKVPHWGADMGFTLSAEGWEGPYYKK